MREHAMLLAVMGWGVVLAVVALLIVRWDGRILREREKRANDREHEYAAKKAALLARHAEEMRCLEAVKAHLLHGVPFDEDAFSPEAVANTVRDLEHALGDMRRAGLL